MFDWSKRDNKPSTQYRKHLVRALAMEKPNYRNDYYRVDDGGISQASYDPLDREEPSPRLLIAWPSHQ
ncbi:hypothetical protein GCM10023325_14070 [Sphingomonas lutea]